MSSSVPNTKTSTSKTDVDGGALVPAVRGAASSASDTGASAVVTEHQTLRSLPPPNLILGSLSPGSIDIPFRSTNWSLDTAGLNKAFQIDPFAHDNIKHLRSCFGFLYWKSLYIEFYKGPQAHYIHVTGVGGFTFARDTLPGKKVCSTLPGASSYDFPTGLAVRVECPFGGLTSSLISSEPVVGRHAVFMMSSHAANEHPWLPITTFDDKGKPLEQTFRQPGVLATATTKVLHYRLGGIICASQPMPGLANIK